MKKGYLLSRVIFLFFIFFSFLCDMIFFFTDSHFFHLHFFFFLLFFNLTVSCIIQFFACSPEKVVESNLEMSEATKHLRLMIANKTDCLKNFNGFLHFLLILLSFYLFDSSFFSKKNVFIININHPPLLLFSSLFLIYSSYNFFLYFLIYSSIFHVLDFYFTFPVALTLFSSFCFCFFE